MHHMHPSSLVIASGADGHNPGFHKWLASLPVAQSSPATLASQVAKEAVGESSRIGKHLGE